MSIRRLNISKSSYNGSNDYARDVHRSGGPGLADIDNLRGAGEHNELQRAIWGSSEVDFGKAVENERVREQADRPHIFVKKLRARR